MNFTELLDVLTHADGEFVSICHQYPGGDWQTEVRPYTADLGAQVIDDYAQSGANVYYSINPVAGPARSNAGRGKADAVTRPSALWCDLDFKASGCGSLTTADTIIDDLSSHIGTEPSAVVFSGNGLHPYWPVEDGRIGDGFTIADAAALVRRWGRLVAAVAAQHGAKVDSVYDLARVLRVPGTLNHPKAVAA